MKPAISALAVGAVLLIAATVGFVVVPEHAPHYGGGSNGIEVKAQICEAAGQGTDQQCEQRSGYSRIAAGAA